jgi:hypothetical protein
MCKLFALLTGAAAVVGAWLLGLRGCGLTEAA